MRYAAAGADDDAPARRDPWCTPTDSPARGDQPGRHLPRRSWPRAASRGRTRVTIAFADLVGLHANSASPLEIEEIGELTDRLFTLASDAANPPGCAW